MWTGRYFTMLLICCSLVVTSCRTKQLTHVEDNVNLVHVADIFVDHCDTFRFTVDIPPYICHDTAIANNTLTGNVIRHVTTSAYIRDTTSQHGRSITHKEPITRVGILRDGSTNIGLLLFIVILAALVILGLYRLYRTR